MSASVGLATCPDDGLAVRELIEAADLGMYRVKAHGGTNAGLASRPQTGTRSLTCLRFRGYSSGDENSAGLAEGLGCRR